jgi:hypothetical protein
VLSIRTDSTAAKKKRKGMVTTRVQLKSGLYTPSNQVLQQQTSPTFATTTPFLPTVWVRSTTMA